MLHELFVLPDMGPSGQIIQHSVDKLPAAYDAMLAARPPLPADIEAAVELARELESGEPAHMGDALTLARALLKCNGREP